MIKSEAFPVEARGKLRNRRSEHWDWDWLDGAFGQTLISPMDIDTVVERRGHFLIIETKYPEETLDKGPRITLEQLSRQANFTVLLVRGKNSTPETWQVCNDGVWSPAQPTNRADFYTRVQRWFERVDKVTN